MRQTKNQHNETTVQRTESSKLWWSETRTNWRNMNSQNNQSTEQELGNMEEEGQIGGHIEFMK